MSKKIGVAGRLGVFCAALVAAAGGIAGDAYAQAKKPAEVTITIERVKALDTIDGGLAGQADFYARVTIAGETVTTQRIRAQNEITPNWVITKSVPPGKVNVKIEMLDRDPLKADDKIDINRLPAKRDLDFVVNTRTKRVEGFASTVRYGTKVVRGGDERKKAEITFVVTGK